MSSNHTFKHLTYFVSGTSYEVQVESAVRDGNGNVISQTYLPLSAGSSLPLTGSLYTRNIYATTDATYNIGDSSHRYANIYAVNLVANLYTNYLQEFTGNPSNSVTTLPLFPNSKGERLAFLPASQIIVEKSVDGGTTWTDAGLSDSAKQMLFSDKDEGTLALPLVNGIKSCNAMVRVTITGMKYNMPVGTAEKDKYSYWNATYVTGTERYCSLREAYFWVNSNIDRIALQIQRATGAAPDTWMSVYDSSDSNYVLNGWSGANQIVFSSGDTGLGGGTTQTGNNWNWRFIFRTCTNQTGANRYNDAYLATTYTTNQQTISSICAYGVNQWTSSNGMMKNSHLYTWDANQIMYLPNSLVSHAITVAANDSYSIGSSPTQEFLNAWIKNIYGSAGTFTGNVSALTFNNYVLGAACAKDVDTSVTSGSSNLVTSDAVYQKTLNDVKSDGSSINQYDLYRTDPENGVVYGIDQYSVGTAYTSGTGNGITSYLNINGDSDGSGRLLYYWTNSTTTYNREVVFDSDKLYYDDYTHYVDFPLVAGTSSSHATLALANNSSQSGYALSSTLATYAPLSGATFTGDVNFATGKNISLVKSISNISYSNSITGQKITLTDTNSTLQSSEHMSYCSDGVIWSADNTTEYHFYFPQHAGTLLTSDGYGASGTWGISISGNAATATSATSAGKATNDSDGNAINTTYLKLAGGTVSGIISFGSSAYADFTSSNNGLRFATSYYVTNIDAQDVTISNIGTTVGSESSANVTFHSGSHGSGSWHVTASPDAYGDNFSVAVTSVSSTGCTIWVRRLYSSSNTALTVHVIAVKEY